MTELDGLPGASRRMAFLQVAFAGHNRSEDLGDHAEVSAGLSCVFSLLAEAGVGRARLLTGLAPGADQLAARAWRDHGLGPVHAVFPHLQDGSGAAAKRLMDAATWLDGRRTEKGGRNPHLAQTRWLIASADLLVAVWTGREARGGGGTADAVRLALEHGIPVLWVKTQAEGAILLIRPEHLDDDFGFLEFMEELRFEREPLVTPATAQALGRTLRHLEDPEDEPGPPAPAPRWKLLQPLWRTYAVFRRLLGGAAPPFAPRAEPADLAAQPGFGLLTEAQRRADEQASRLGAVHRSQQIILLALAIIAATVGSAAAFWPGIKLVSMIVELSLAVIALLIWRDSERGRRHEQWGAARRLAEDLRLERVAWTLGVNTGSHKGELSSGVQARRARRIAGLPEGRFDQARVRAWGGWSVEELISGQGAYHRAQATINGHMAHRVHQIENVSFIAFLTVLCGYVAASLVLDLEAAHTPGWLGALVAMTGAVVPAIGAATLALEATLSLAEEARRSEVLASRLEAIAGGLGQEPRIEALQAAAKAAIRLARVQEDHWIEGTGRRRLYRGG